LISFAKNKITFLKGKEMHYGIEVGKQLYIAGVSYTLLLWFSLLLCSVKCEQEEMV
jgi:hypothetical protein